LKERSFTAHRRYPIRSIGFTPRDKQRASLIISLPFPVTWRVNYCIVCNGYRESRRLVLATQRRHPLEYLPGLRLKYIRNIFVASVHYKNLYVISRFTLSGTLLRFPPKGKTNNPIRSFAERRKSRTSVQPVSTPKQVNSDKGSATRGEGRNSLFFSRLSRFVRSQISAIEPAVLSARGPQSFGSESARYEIALSG